jgi:hypothetical protein
VLIDFLPADGSVVGDDFLVHAAHARDSFLFFVIKVTIELCLFYKLDYQLFVYFPPKCIYICEFVKNQSRCLLFYHNFCYCNLVS